MTSKLYELTEAYTRLMDFAEESDKLQEILAELKDDIEYKVENTAKVILSLEADTEEVAGEIARLTAKKKALVNSCDSLREYLLKEMSSCNIDRVKRPIFTVAIRNNPPSVNILDIEVIPETYIRIKKEADKRAIIDQFKATGEILPGCEMIIDKKSISIR